VAAELLIYTTRTLNQFVIRELTSENHVLAIPESGVISYNDGAGDVTVNALEGVFFEKGKHYTRTVLEPCFIHYFRFSSDEPVFTDHHVKFQSTDRIKSTLGLLNKLSADISLHGDFSFKTNLFLDIVNQYKIENAIHTPKEKVHDEIIEKAMEYMKNNLHTKIILPVIAEKSTISYVHFIRRFKSATGITPFQYLANLRLERAQQLLTDSNLPIKDIAPLCGFENEYYFSNFFKKFKHISPSRFRNDI